MRNSVLKASEALHICHIGNIAKPLWILYQLSKFFLNFGYGRKSVTTLPHLMARRLRQSGQKTYLAILLWSLQQWTNFESISYYFSLIDPLPKIWNQFFYSSKSLCGKKIAICKRDFSCYWIWKNFCHLDTIQQC